MGGGGGGGGGQEGGGGGEGPNMQWGWRPPVENVSTDRFSNRKQRTETTLTYDCYSLNQQSIKVFPLVDSYFIFYNL